MNIALIVDREINLEIAQSSRFINLGYLLAVKGISVTLTGIKSTYNNPETERLRIAGISFPKICQTNEFIRRIFRVIFFPLWLLIKVPFMGLDCVITRGTGISACLIPVMKLLGKTTIYDFHGYHYKQENLLGNKSSIAILKFMEAVVLALADKILVISEGVKSELPEKYQDKVLFLPNGVNIERLNKKIDKIHLNDVIEKYHICRNKKIVGFVGFWGIWQVIEDLLQSINYLQEVQIIIIGKGLNFEKFKQDYQHLSIVFTGSIKKEEVLALYKLMNIMLVPYNGNIYMARIPGFFQTRKVKEYLAQGKPIIVSDIVGKDTFLKENENALFYKPGQPEDLAQKIKLLLNNPALCKIMRQNNLLLAKEFSWENVLQNSGLLNMLS